MHMRQIARLIVGTVLAVVLAGCGSAAPATLAEIPVPPGLERYEGAAETTLDGMWTVALQARAKQPTATELDYRWLPSPATWESVAPFYAEQLDPNWRRDADAPMLAGGRWTRATARGAQQLVVRVVGIGQPEGTVLVIALTTE